MTDHPYAGGNTLTPGDVAEDDPFSNEEICESCDEYVDTVSGRMVCPACGSELE